MMSSVIALPGCVHSWLACMATRLLAAHSNSVHDMRQMKKRSLGPSCQKRNNS